MAYHGALATQLPARATAASVEDHARFRKAFADHYAGIWRFLRRMGVSSQQVDDSAQHVFLVTLEALSRIVHGSERAFLYATAVRVAHGVRRRREREVPTATAEYDSSPLPPPDELIDQRRAREVLNTVLERVDLDARTVFVLFEFEEFTVPEIAEILTIPVGTASSRLRRARERFQALVRVHTAPPVRRAP
jgi:RNA polymerase sigma-70 factor, ECF subfamily